MPTTLPDRAFEFRLRDGSPVLIRPVRSDDKERLREGFERLSLVSRYRRFMNTPAGLSDEQLRYFTELDYHDHMAWIALDPTQSGQPALGIARHIRLANRPTAAEVAVTVMDSHQGRGLGTLLLGVLARSAAEQGIDTWVAWVLTENTPMLRIFKELGAREAQSQEPGVLRIEVPVPEDPADLPRTAAGRTFRATAKAVGGEPAAPRRPRGAKKTPKRSPKRP